MRRMWVTDALGKTTTFTYDAGNWLTQITAPSPDGSAPQPVTTFAYDCGLGKGGNISV